MNFRTAARPQAAPVRGPDLTVSSAARVNVFGNPAMVLLLAFVAWMWIQTLWAANLAWHIEGAILFTKYAILFVIFFKLITTPQMVEAFAWAHVVGCLLWGWEAYNREVRGRFEIVLGPGVDDSNLIGFHMITGLTFAGFMFLSLKGWKKWAVLAPIPFMLNLIILTASRGAFLGLIAAGLAGWALGPKKYRFKATVCAALAVALFLLLASDSELFWERTSTISVADGEERDLSAQTRIVAAEAAINMFKDNPLGFGHRGNEAVSPRYFPPEFLTGGRRSAHNTTMAVLADHGIPGILLYIALHVWVVVTLWKLNRRDKQGLAPELGTYRAAVGAGLIATLICGLFVNLFKAEVAVWLLGMLVVLDALSQRPQQVEQRGAPSQPAPASRFPRPGVRLAASRSGAHQRR